MLEVARSLIYEIIVDVAEKQSKPLCNVGDTVKVLDDLKVPSKILEYLSLGPKHPILDKFNEIQFLADIDGLLHNLNSNGASKEKLDEVNALALWYNKEMKKQREDPMLNEVKKYLTKEKLKAVPFDRNGILCNEKHHLRRETCRHFER